MNALSQLALIVAISLSATGLTWWIKGPPVRTQPCDPAKLMADEICLESISPDEPVVWVDARSRKEWIRNGIPGSVLWNLDPTEDMLALEAGAVPQIVGAPMVVVYCGDENCGISRQVAKRIHDLGLGARVFVLHGGWKALEASGRTSPGGIRPK